MQDNTSLIDQDHSGAEQPVESSLTAARQGGNTNDIALPQAQDNAQSFKGGTAFAAVNANLTDDESDGDHSHNARTTPDVPSWSQHLQSLMQNNSLQDIFGLLFASGGSTSGTTGSHPCQSTPRPNPQNTTSPADEAPGRPRTQIPLPPADMEPLLDSLDSALLPDISTLLQALGSSSHPYNLSLMSAGDIGQAQRFLANLQNTEVTDGTPSIGAGSSGPTAAGLPVASDPNQRMQPPPTAQQAQVYCSHLLSPSSSTQPDQATPQLLQRNPQLQLQQQENLQQLQLKTESPQPSQLSGLLSPQAATPPTAQAPTTPPYILPSGRPMQPTPLQPFTNPSDPHLTQMAELHGDPNRRQILPEPLAARHHEPAEITSLAAAPVMPVDAADTNDGGGGGRDWFRQPLPFVGSSQAVVPSFRVPTGNAPVGAGGVPEADLLLECRWSYGTTSAEMGAVLAAAATATAGMAVGGAAEGSPGDAAKREGFELRTPAVTTGAVCKQQLYESYNPCTGQMSGGVGGVLEDTAVPAAQPSSASGSGANTPQVVAGAAIATTTAAGSVAEPTPTPPPPLASSPGLPSLMPMSHQQRQPPSVPTATWPPSPPPVARMPPQASPLPHSPFPNNTAMAAGGPNSATPTGIAEYGTTAVGSVGLPAPTTQNPCEQPPTAAMQPAASSGGWGQPPGPSAVQSPFAAASLPGLTNNYALPQFGASPRQTGVQSPDGGNQHRPAGFGSLPVNVSMDGRDTLNSNSNRLLITSGMAPEHIGDAGGGSNTLWRGASLAAAEVDNLSLAPSSDNRTLGGIGGNSGQKRVRHPPQRSGSAVRRSSGGTDEPTCSGDDELDDAAGGDDDAAGSRLGEVGGGERTWRPEELPPPVAVAVTGLSREVGEDGRRKRVTVQGVFHVDRYLAHQECILYENRFISRSGFEKAGGSTTAKWHCSIKIAGSNTTLGTWLTALGLPLFKGGARKSKRQRAAEQAMTAPLPAARRLPTPTPTALHQHLSHPHEPHPLSHPHHPHPHHLISTTTQMAHKPGPCPPSSAAAAATRGSPLTTPSVWSPSRHHAHLPNTSHLPPAPEPPYRSKSDPGGAAAAAAAVRREASLTAPTDGSTTSALARSRWMSDPSSLPTFPQHPHPQGLVQQRHPLMLPPQFDGPPPPRDLEATRPVSAASRPPPHVMQPQPQGQGQPQAQPQPQAQGQPRTTLPPPSHHPHPMVSPPPGKRAHLVGPPSLATAMAPPPSQRGAPPLFSPAATATATAISASDIGAGAGDSTFRPPYGSRIVTSGVMRSQSSSSSQPTLPPPPSLTATTTTQLQASVQAALSYEVARGGRSNAGDVQGQLLFSAAAVQRRGEPPQSAARMAEAGVMAAPAGGGYGTGGIVQPCKEGLTGPVLRNPGPYPGGIAEGGDGGSQSYGYPYACPQPYTSYPFAYSYPYPQPAAPQITARDRHMAAQLGPEYGTYIKSDVGYEEYGRTGTGMVRTASGISGGAGEAARAAAAAESSGGAFGSGR